MKPEKKATQTNKKERDFTRSFLKYSKNICVIYTDTLLSRNASLSDVFLSVLSFLLPMIKAQGT